MANKRILIDTSIIIEYLRKSDKTNSYLLRLVRHYRLTISVITVFELYAGATTPEKKINIDDLLQAFEVIELSSPIAQETAMIIIELKKKNNIIEIADVFIGATALFHNFKLATTNIKHFERIPNLKILDLENV